MPTQLQRVVALCRLKEPMVYEPELLERDFPFLVANGVAPWCFYQLKQAERHNVDPSVLALFRQSYMAQLVRHGRLTHTYKQVGVLFRQAALPMVALKGMALANHVYPDGALRPMGDIDVLVPEGKGADAIALLKTLGASEAVVPRSALHEQTSAHMRAMQLDGVLIEVHQRLFALGSAWNVPLRRVISEAGMGQGPVDVLPDVWFGYHLAAHACYGYQMGGMRLGWLLDLALLMDRQPDPAGFVRQVMALNVRFRNELADVWAWADLLRHPDVEWPVSFPPLAAFRQPDGIKKNHRWINIGNIWMTPGIGNKLHLFFRELFPCNDYMRFRYGRTGIGTRLRRFRLR
ncbi:MAG: nucleotidyltransferase family protein [Breznakibacter sp.]